MSGFSLEIIAKKPVWTTNEIMWLVFGDGVNLFLAGNEYYDLLGKKDGYVIIYETLLRMEKQSSAKFGFDPNEFMESWKNGECNELIKTYASLVKPVFLETAFTMWQDFMAEKALPKPESEQAKFDKLKLLIIQEVAKIVKPGMNCKEILKYQPIINLRANSGLPDGKPAIGTLEEWITAGRKLAKVKNKHVK